MKLDVLTILVHLPLCSEQPDKMDAHATLVSSVVSLIFKTKKALLALPYKEGLIGRLAETLTHLLKGVEVWHWPTSNDMALKALEGALVQALR